MGVSGSELLNNGQAVRVDNPGGGSPYLLVCDHASNFIPAEFGALGLPAADLERHIAWDPGALPVAQGLAEMLDATLVHSGISRLVIDCNRPLGADNLIWTVSEGTVIPGNQNLDAMARQRRIDLAYTPFHDAIDATIRDRLARGQETRVVSIHSFTPVYYSVERPWHIGVIHDFDERLAGPLISHLREIDGIAVGVNEPYSPADNVYFTLEKHARSRQLACAMIEIRNDEIGDAASQLLWAQRLAGFMSKLELAQAPLSPARQAL